MEQALKIPTRLVAERLLAEAEKMNPGAWVEHSRVVARAAEAIASRHPQLDQECAYALGLLHDIGRREGRSQGRHILDGYRYLLSMGYPEAARVCLTHSFPLPTIHVAVGEMDCPPEDIQFLSDFLAQVEYDEYDRLIQLCDALALPSGFCLIEKRLVDVAMRYGLGLYTIPRWKRFLELQQQFERAIGGSIYALLPGVVENTFGFSDGESPHCI